MTPAEARKAIRWCMKHEGLATWIPRTKLDFTDDVPEWVCQSGGIEGGGRCAYNRSYRSLRIWVGPLACAADDNVDPLQVLFHEVLHLSADIAGLPGDGPAVEFFINRQAEALAFAYTHGMKPWR